MDKVVYEISFYKGIIVDIDKQFFQDSNLLIMHEVFLKMFGRDSHA